MSDTATTCSQLYGATTTASDCIAQSAVFTQGNALHVVTSSTAYHLLTSGTFWALLAGAVVLLGLFAGGVAAEAAKQSGRR